jgi:hypothetical protein
MGRERNTGRRSNIRAQRASMILGVFLKTSSALRKPDDSRRLWVENRQDSSMDEALRRHSESLRKAAAKTTGS